MCRISCQVGWLCQINNTQNSTLASLSLLTTTSATITIYNINSDSTLGNYKYIFYFVFLKKIIAWIFKEQK